MASENFTLPAPPVGIIESLTSGFETVANRLYLVLIPIALDLLLWLGPRISYRQALDASGMPNQIAKVGIAFQQVLYPFFPVQYFHPMSSVQYWPVLALPSVMASRDASRLPFGLIPPVMSVPSLSGMFLLFLGSFQIGLAVLIPYFGLIAQAVKGDRINWSWLLRRSLFIFGQLVIVEGIFVLPVYLCAVVLFSVVLTEPNALSDPTWLVVPAIMFMSLWLTITVLLSFTVHSMLLNNRNVVASMWDSMRVVQWNMPATLGLLILIATIFLGMQYIWRMADPGSWIVLAAIGANGFVSTGLVAATFVFFKDRYRYWAEFREQLLAELERRRILRDQNSKQP